MGTINFTVPAFNVLMVVLHAKTAMYVINVPKDFYMQERAYNIAQMDGSVWLNLIIH
jgi:hypothetical protein